MVSGSIYFVYMPLLMSTRKQAQKPTHQTTKDLESPVKTQEDADVSVLYGPAGMQSGDILKHVVVEVNPGICGFDCRVTAEPAGRRAARTVVQESGCPMIRKFSDDLGEVTLQELFVPLTRNRIFRGAEKAGCHLACPVPSAVVKAAEACLELALPKAVTFAISVTSPQSETPGD